MNDSDPSSSSNSATPASQSTGNGGDSRDSGNDDRGGESWLERLKSVIGFKGSGSIRSDLEEVLERDELTGEEFSPEERVMLRNILRLRDTRVEDVMVPRADIDSVEVGVSLGELTRTFLDSGHSRMPVYRNTLDDPIGMVHIKDLMGYIARSSAAAAEDDAGKTNLDLRLVDLSKPLAEIGLVRSVLFIPPSMPVMALLANMQASRMQLALVIDEYGGTDGIVSLEDVVETVVGDIEDEHDDEEGPMIEADQESGWLVDARADLDEVAAAVGAGFTVGEDGEDVDTVGGLVFTLLGRIPVRGELVRLNDTFELEILDADPRRVKRLRIRRPDTAARTDPRRRTRSPKSSTTGA